MPWKYYGAKHGLARKYPAPLPDGPIIEPFAGSAGYSVFWAEPWRRVMLFDKDERVVDAWRNLLGPDPIGYLDAVETDMRERRMLDHIMTISLAGHGGGRRMPNSDFALQEWLKARRRIEAVLPRLNRWTCEQADYQDVPDIRGTWHIDPPYRPSEKAAGTLYREGADDLDYEHLAEWSRSRRGMVMVCEQEPADWLPFRPLARQNAQATAVRGPMKQSRTEVIWTQGAGSTLGSYRAGLHDTAKRRRSERIRPLKELRLP